MNPLPDKMFVAADNVPLRFTDAGSLEVLLVRRGNEPFEGRWALPGGFVEQHEDLPDAAARELLEETGVETVWLGRVGAWGTPGRDPRGRVVSVVFLGICALGAPNPRGGDDAAEARWHKANEPPPMAFDHDEIFGAALTRLRSLCRSTHLALAFFGGRFLISELAELLTEIEGREPERWQPGLLTASALVVAEEPAESSGGSGLLRFHFVGSDYAAPLGGARG